ncbi:MAG: 50S ribosomal protein L25 [Chloroflexia bacterium]
MSETVLQAERREVTGKKVRRLRRSGWVPAVFYGPRMEALPVQVDRRALSELYRQAEGSTLIQVVLEGQTYPALIREVQRDPISQEILHLDLVRVDLERPISAQVPVILKGDSPVVEQGLAVLTHGLEEIEVRGLPAAIPAHLEVDVSVITRPDQAVHAGDLTLPPGVHLLTDPKAVVVYATPTRRLEEEEKPAEEAAPTGPAAPKEE